MVAVTAVGLQIASIATAAAGVAVSVAGSISSARAQSKASKFNAQVAENNATIARQQGEAAATSFERDTRRRLATLRASVGGAGIDLSGSPLAVLEDSARQEKLDELTIKHNAEIQGVNFDSQAALQAANAKNATSAGFFSAGSSLLFGAANAGVQSGAFSDTGGGFGQTDTITPETYGVSQSL